MRHLPLDFATRFFPARLFAPTLLARALFPAALLLWASGVAPAAGHGLDPSLLVLEESGPFVEVSWRTPVARATPLHPVLPCPDVDGSRVQSVSDDGRTWIRSWRIDCGEDGLEGREVRVEGLDLRTGDALVRWVDEHQRVGQAVLDAARPAVTVPATATGSIFGDYLLLGVEHILFGFDHLAFVFGLMLLVKGRRRLIWTLTAFTVGHSLTLAVVVLGVVTPPSSWVEAGIAASILLLAVELAEGLRAERVEPRRTGGRSGLLTRRPWLVAGAFGLLHGCGFAGALRDVGLPAGEIPRALLAFNVGIEAGQLLFVAAFWLLAVAVRGVTPRLAGSARLEWAAVYALGTLAAYWTIDRLAGLI